jgi:hypothetical protein
MRIVQHGHRQLGMPAGMHEKVWASVVWQCFDQVPQARPVMNEVVLTLNAIMSQ